MRACWQVIESKQASVARDEILFTDLDFEKNKLYKITGFFLTADLINPCIRINDDAGTNYNKSHNSMNTAGAFSGAFETGTATFAEVASGFGAGEQVTIECLFMKTDVGIMFQSKTFTNGSGAGDTHYFRGEWTGSNANKMSFLSKISNPGVFGDFGYPTRLDLAVLGEGIKKQ